MKRIIVCAALAAVALSSQVSAQTKIPSDAKETCTVSKGEFRDWFQSGVVAMDAVVNPADSARFPNSAKVCDFYKWAGQMFWWLTSPDPGGDIMLDGASFYNVGENGVLNPANGGHMNTAIRATKTDEISGTGQAGSSGALMSQGGSLVYYGEHVNDIWAYYNTATFENAPDQITMDDFPISSLEVSQITSWAAAHIKGAISLVTDPEVMAMEIKTSWVDASTLSNASDYVTISATVPTFTAQTDGTWLQTGTSVKTLALVGMHVVGTVQDHPEMVWATFEHISNTPDAAYWYKNKSGAHVQQPFDSAGTYLFMATDGELSSANTQCFSSCASSTANFLVPGASCKAPYTATCENGITASNTVRTNPWGAKTSTNSGSKADKATIKNNTYLVSYNHKMMKNVAALIPGDVRGNYLQIGGIWTTLPDPVGKPVLEVTAPIPHQKAAGYSDKDLRGSLLLANSTMETYRQSDNCFDCHNVKDKDPGRKISHSIGYVQPLPTQ